MRSRAVSLPFACWLSMALGPPPSRIFSSSFPWHEAFPPQSAWQELVLCPPVAAAVASLPIRLPDLVPLRDVRKPHAQMRSFDDRPAPNRVPRPCSIHGSLHTRGKGTARFHSSDPGPSAQNP